LDTNPADGRKKVPEGYTALRSYGFVTKKPVMAGACDSYNPATVAKVKDVPLAFRRGTLLSRSWVH
jgi:hypothetical protein